MRRRIPASSSAPRQRLRAAGCTGCAATSPPARRCALRAGDVSPSRRRPFFLEPVGRELRLGDEAGGTRLHRPRRVLRRLVGGEDQHHHRPLRRRLREDALGGLQAADPRQVDVHENQVGGQLTGGVNGRLSGFHLGGDLEAVGRLHHQPGGDAERLLVDDDEHLHSHLLTSKYQGEAVTVSRACTTPGVLPVPAVRREVHPYTGIKCRSGWSSPRTTTSCARGCASSSRPRRASSCSPPAPTSPPSRRRSPSSIPMLCSLTSGCPPTIVMRAWWWPTGCGTRLPALASSCSASSPSPSTPSRCWSGALPGAPTCSRRGCRTSPSW